MAAIPMTFVGIATGDDGRSGNVTLVGMASITGLGVGGGPIVPPDKPPIDPGLRPEHPIYWPPGTLPHPEHPIVLPPDPPTEPPVDPPTSPPSANWVWGYSRPYGWHPVYVPGPGEAGPKTA